MSYPRSVKHLPHMLPKKGLKIHQDDGGYFVLETSWVEERWVIVAGPFDEEWQANAWVQDHHR